VNEQFKQSVERIVQERVSQFDNYLSELRVYVDDKVKGINRVLIDLSQQTQSVQTKEDQQGFGGLEGRMVLWVDDHPENNEYQRKILEDVGVRFRLALSTDEAVEQYRKTKFDLIITDMGRASNEKAGLDLLQDLKRLESRTPVIVFASHRALVNHGREALDLGAVSITTGTPTLLKEVIRTLTRVGPGFAGERRDNTLRMKRKVT
jgi:CheY-like chemotaxis protein